MSQQRLIGFLVIAAFTILVYFPSLWHGPRSDQIVYFYVTDNKHDLSSLTLSCFSLNRWGIFAPGDDKLFRPFVFAFLGVENYFFRYKFWMWQAMGILLHLAVIWFLLKLLWRLVPGIAAFVCTLFFAMLLMNMEMVILTHINGYMIFVIALLIALDQIYQCYIDTSHEDQSRRMVIIAVCFFIAGMVYETANVFAIIVAILLFKKRTSWVIWVSPLLYFIFDLMSIKAYHVVPHVHKPDILQGLMGMMIAGGFWIYSALWPGFVQIYFDARNMIGAESIDLKYCYICIGAVLGLLAGGYRRLEFAQKRFMILITLLLFFYAFVIVLGREQTQGIKEILGHNLHYYYPFWALLMIVVGILISTYKDQRVKMVLAGILVALSVFNGVRLYQINAIQAHGSRASILLVRYVEELVKEKKNEKDFSFYVPADYPGNYPYNDGHGVRSSFIGMLFPQYYKENSPKYIFHPDIP